MTAAMERLASEQAFHDAQARCRADYFGRQPQQLLVDDAAYLAHESWIGPAIGQLGDLRGQQVLDLGCGHGMAAVVFARRGARVTACDLSAAYLAEASRRADANGVQVDFVKLNGDVLPFGDGSFDRVWGNAILHHLDIPTAGREIRRILRPGGLAILCEPWGENPVLNALRRWFPYPGKQRTPDEQPLASHDVQALQTIFSRIEVRGFQLLSMIRRAVRKPGLVKPLETLDAALLRCVPRLQRFCRYIVLTLQP